MNPERSRICKLFYFDTQHREFKYEPNAASFHRELMVKLGETYLLVSEIAYNEDSEVGGVERGWFILLGVFGTGSQW